MFNIVSIFCFILVVGLLIKNEIDISKQKSEIKKARNKTNSIIQITLNLILGVISFYLWSSGLTNNYGLLISILNIFCALFLVVRLLKENDS